MFAAATLRATRPILRTRQPFAFASFSKMTLTSLPSVEVMQGFPDVKKINITDYCAGKNVIIVGLPGAFTPTWSAKQVPGYIENQEALKAVGIEEVIVYCVNDPAVSKCWKVQLLFEKRPFFRTASPDSNLFVCYFMMIIILSFH